MLQAVRYDFCGDKDAEISAAQFMETKPIMSEFDARLNYYLVNSIIILHFFKQK